jgi:peptidoglycan hydrolase-like protein with peptidoglycan-binding domain
MTSLTGDATTSGPDLRQAAERLARLGFVVVNGSHPEETGTAQLLVALRSRPTLEHFDTELVEHWTTIGGRGRIEEITRSTPIPRQGTFSWGTIRAVDRVEAFNSFMGFGGDVTLAALDAETTIVVFESPALIVRSTGHSQSVDPLTSEVGAFFARMKVPIDFSPGAEQRIAALSPRALHAAMLASLQRRYARTEALREAHPAIAAWASREARRMRDEHAADWEAGAQLAADLELDRD